MPAAAPSVSGVTGLHILEADLRISDYPELLHNCIHKGPSHSLMVIIRKCRLPLDIIYTSLVILAILHEDSLGTILKYHSFLDCIAAESTYELQENPSEFSLDPKDFGETKSADYTWMSNPKEQPKGSPLKHN